MPVVHLILTSLAGFYVGNALFYGAGLIRLRKGQLRSPARPGDWPLVSILVPAHNEAAHIQTCLRDLAGQDYPAGKLEIIAIDDQSDDDTAGIIERESERDSRIVLLHHHRDPSYKSFKKQALSAGVRQAAGEVIVTTDADCRMGPRWLRTMITQFDQDTGLVAGPLVYRSEPGFGTHFQVLGNAVLTTAAAALIRNGLPVTCNAANLAYRKTAFEEVHGFKGLENILSGDDDLLLQKIAYRSPWKVKTTLHPESIVSTGPAGSLGALLNQYSRWGSKGFKYPVKRVKLYLTLLFGSLMAFYAAVVFLPPSQWMPFWIGKLIVDSGMAIQLVRIYQNNGLWKGFIPVFLIQPLLIIYAVIRGSLGFFRWK